MHRDEWTLMEYRPKDSPERWFFRKNLAPAIAPGHRDYGFIAYLTFHYHPRDASGLPSSEDEESFSHIQHQLEGLEIDGLSIHVAAVTKSGIRDFLFYTCDPNLFLWRAEDFRKTYSQFQVECEIKPDPQWNHYEDFPSSMKSESS